LITQEEDIKNDVPEALGRSPLWLIRSLGTYLTDFTKWHFRAFFAISSVFSGGKKSRAASVYHAGINQKLRGEENAEGAHDLIRRRRFRL
jgi:hypothetical protein